MCSKLLAQTFTSTKELLCYLLSLPPGPYLASMIGLIAGTGLEKMVLAGLNQDV